MGDAVFNRSRRLASVSKVGLAGAIMCTTLVLSLGSNVPSSSALGSSAFCKTLFSFESIAVKYEAPKTSTTIGYHAWAKELLPFYEKLASEAPANGKVVLNELVTIFKYYTNASSLTSIEAYIAANHTKFEAGTKALAKDIEGCA
jgi:hypothetical protein